MKKSTILLLSVIIICLLAACTTAPSTLYKDNRIHVTILHLNDLYEITPLSGGRKGGIARVATLRKQLLARNPNTITTLGGDFFNPSAIGTAPYGDDQLAGRQMVDVLNHFGLDYATFGNHEFDLKKNQFQQRLQETEFTWVSSNVFNSDGRPFAGVRQNIIISVTDRKQDKTFRIGLFGLTLAANKSGYVSYTDPLISASKQIEQLAGQTDFIIALTHQTIDDDEALLHAYPQVSLLLGGHEHINYQRWRGNYSLLLKGDANARSVYVIDLYFDPVSGNTEIRPTFVPIDDELAEDAVVKTVVDKWMNIAFDAFRKQGFEPENVVTTTPVALDGLESNVRNSSTNLTRLVANSMLAAYSEAELSVYNSGLIRFDEILPPGIITVYDILRALSFGGFVQLAEIKGSLLQEVLNQGLKNKDSGGYLQSAGTQHVDGVWYINNRPIKPGKFYKIAINDYLASGKERSLGYLKVDNPDFTILQQAQIHEIRQLVIDALAK